MTYDSVVQELDGLIDSLDEHVTIKDIGLALGELRANVFERAKAEKAHTPTDDEREAHRRVIDLWFANWRSIGKVSPALEVAIDSLEGMVSDALDAGFRRSEVPEPSAEAEDERIEAWHYVADHEAFKACYGEEQPLIDSVLARITQLHECETTVNELAPVPEPVTQVVAWIDRTLGLPMYRTPALTDYDDAVVTTLTTVRKMLNGTTRPDASWRTAEPQGEPSSEVPEPSAAQVALCDQCGEAFSEHSCRPIPSCIHLPAPVVHDESCEADWGPEGQESPCRCGSPSVEASIDRRIVNLRRVLETDYNGTTGRDWIAGGLGGPLAKDLLALIEAPAPLPEPQGEPSDAQVDAAWAVIGGHRVLRETVRAVLRAAGVVGQEGEQKHG